MAPESLQLHRAVPAQQCQDGWGIPGEVSLLCRCQRSRNEYSGYIGGSEAVDIETDSLKAVLIQLSVQVFDASILVSYTSSPGLERT